jgi:hypothetical protein
MIFDGKNAGNRPPRCPRCKQFFVIGEEICRRGFSWFYHKDCTPGTLSEEEIRRRLRKETAPPAGQRFSNGRVIRKVDGL